MNYRVVTVGEDIYHHGIKGQKWGVRRYQNKDGSLTSAGKKRYSEDGTVTEDGKVRRMTDKERVLFSKVASVLENASDDEEDLAKEIEYINTQLLNGSRFDTMRLRYNPDTDSVKVTSFAVEGRRAVEQALSDSQRKALDKVVRDHRRETGQQIAGILIGAPLAGLALSYFRNLGMI